MTNLASGLCATVLVVLATALTAQPPGPGPHDLEEIPVTLRPGVGSRVVSPVGVSLLVPMPVKSLVLSTARLRLDGHDITPLLWAVVAAGPRYLAPRFGGVKVTAPMALGLGEHRLRLTVRNASGYRHLAQTRFTVITEREWLLRRGVRLPAESPADTTPPIITFEPGQNAFVQTSVPRLVVHYTDGPGSGVNTATLKILLDGKDVTQSFTIGPAAATYQIPSAAPLKNGRRRISAQVQDHAKNQANTSITFIVFADSARHLWFYPPTNQPHTVGHAIHSFQNYSSQPSAAYFHHGIDIMEPAGTNVLASAGGLVSNMGWYGSKPLYYEVAILDPDGFLWEYHHVDEPTIPQAVKDAYAKQTPISAGTLIGKNVKWPARSHYGPYFHHIHLNIKDPDGRYLNGLHFLLKSGEKTAPTAYGIYVIPQGGDTAFNRTGEQNVTISGQVDVVLRADDIVTSPYQLGVHEIRYAITELSATEGHNVDEILFWRFNDLPGGSSTTAQVWDVHQATIRHDGGTYQTQGNYNGRRFYYVLTNNDGRSLSSANHWDTTARDQHGKRLFPDGSYRITVKLKDEAGNQTVKTLDVRVRNP
jgi:murein DD-endopeptidase MepM/ murein hydrolase activator NlpD